MTEEDKVLVQQFVANDKMVNAVSNVLLNTLSLDKGTDEPHFLMSSNENLGASVRAKVEAVRMLRDSFKLLSKFKKTEQKVVSEINQAR